MDDSMEPEEGIKWPENINGGFTEESATYILGSHNRRGVQCDCKACEFSKMFLKGVESERQFKADIIQEFVKDEEDFVKEINELKSALEKEKNTLRAAINVAIGLYKRSPGCECALMNPSDAAIEDEIMDRIKWKMGENKEVKSHE